MNYYLEKLCIKEKLGYHLFKDFHKKLNKRKLKYLFKKICYEGLNKEKEFCYLWGQIRKQELCCLLENLSEEESDWGLEKLYLLERIIRCTYTDYKKSLLSCAWRLQIMFG